MFRSSSLAVLAVAIAAAGPAFANNIPLFNTGVDAAGNPLANNAAETHYTLVGGGDLRVATSANGFPIGPWLGDDSASAWVGPNTDGSLDGDVATYDYRLTFSLDGLNAATASIMGRWSTDNEGLDILINGVSTGNSLNFDQPFTNWYDFSVNSGFVSGVNTIDFLVHNDGGPTGLRVEMTGTADAAVPEPASWALMLGGFGMVGGAMRSRRKAAVRFA